MSFISIGGFVFVRQIPLNTINKGDVKNYAYYVKNKNWRTATNEKCGLATRVLLFTRRNLAGEERFIELAAQSKRDTSRLEFNCIGGKRYVCRTNN